MILAVNIGNTNIRAMLRPQEGEHRLVMPTGAVKSPDDIVKRLRELQAQPKITGCIISSVVPEKTAIVARAVTEYANVKPRFVDVTRCGIDISGYGGICGQDRIVCAAAALNKYPPPLIVADFGTASTVNVIGRGGTFLGGAILPGIRMGMRALSENTALLTQPDSLYPVRVIGRDTRECILSGAVVGTVCSVEGYVRRISAEMGEKPTVVITGGDAPLLLEHCRFKYLHEPDLLMDGLFHLYKESSTKSNRL